MQLTPEDIIEAFKAHGGTIPAKNEQAFKDYIIDMEDILEAKDEAEFKKVKDAQAKRWEKIAKLQSVD